MNGPQRLFLVIAASWLILLGVFYEPWEYDFMYGNWKPFLGLGVAPIALIIATWWVKSGYKNNVNRPAQSAIKVHRSIKESIFDAIDGKEDLWKVFWVYNFLATFLLRIGALVLVIAINAAPTVLQKFLLGFPFICFTVIYYFWALYSLWMCAFNTSSKIWAYLSRAYVFIYVIAILGIVAAIVIPTINNLSFQPS